jgi:hypothetical protein
VLLLPAAGLQVDMPPTSTASAAAAAAAPLPPAGHHNAPSSSGGGSGSSSGGSAAGRVLTDFPRLMTDQIRNLAPHLKMMQDDGQQLTEEQHQVLLFAELLEQVKQGFQPSPAHAQLLREHWQMETEATRRQQQAVAEAEAYHARKRAEEHRTETEAIQRQLAALRGIEGTEVQCAVLELALGGATGRG